MKLLADENFPLKSFSILREGGFDIIHISIEYPSVSDIEVIDLAIKEKRIIITFDSDYGTLVFKKKMKPLGVIYLRFQDFTPDYPGQYLIGFFKRNLLRIEKMFTVIDSNENIRQRKIEY